MTTGQTGSLDLLNFLPVLPGAPQEAVNELSGGSAVGIKEMCFAQRFSCIYLGSCGSYGTMCLTGTQVMHR